MKLDEKEFEQVKTYLTENQEQLVQELNFRLLCDTEWKNNLYGRVLWVEEIEITEFELPYKIAKSHSILGKIKDFFSLFLK